MSTSELITLLSEEEKKFINDEILNNSFHTVESIKNVYAKNQKDDNYTTLDVDLLILIDLKLNMPIFITNDNIYTAEDMISIFKLDKFKIQPESLFNKQRVEMIGDDYFIKDQEDTINASSVIYNTRVYIGKEKWNEFLIVYKFMKSITFIQENRPAIENNGNAIENIFNVFSNK